MYARQYQGEPRERTLVAILSALIGHACYCLPGLTNDGKKEACVHAEGGLYGRISYCAACWDLRCLLAFAPHPLCRLHYTNCHGPKRF